MKRTWKVFAVAVAAMSLLSACGNGASGSGDNSGAAEEGSIVIKYSTWANEGEAAYEGMVRFKELVEEGSDGVIRVDLYPSNQAGSTNEQVEQVTMNQLQMMSSGDPGIVELEYLCLPYLFDSLDQYTEFMNSDLGQTYLQQAVEERNTLVLDTLPRSPRIISSNIRVPERDYYVMTFEAFGANPTPMDMGEVYSAMQTGVVDGQENPIETIVSYGFQNVNDYLVMTNHMIKPAFVMINNDFFTGLSEEYQQLIVDACAEAREYASDYMETAMENDLQTCIDAGMTVCEPDLEEFAAATQSVRDELGTQVWGEDGYALVKEIAAG